MFSFNDDKVGFDHGDGFSFIKNRCDYTNTAVVHERGFTDNEVFGYFSKSYADCKKRVMFAK